MIVRKTYRFLLRGMCKFLGHTWYETGFNDFLSEYMRFCKRCGEFDSYYKEER